MTSVSKGETIPLPLLSEVPHSDDIRVRKIYVRDSLRKVRGEARGNLTVFCNQKLQEGDFGPLILP